MTTAHGVTFEINRLITAPPTAVATVGGSVGTGSGEPGNSLAEAAYTVDGGNVGSGYVEGDQTRLVFSPPDLPNGGRRAKGTATVTGGGVTGVNVTDAGQGYLFPPTATLPGATGSGVVFPEFTITSGGPTADYGVPIAVNDLEDAAAAFGPEGSLLEFVTLTEELATAWVTLVRYQEVVGNWTATHGNINAALANLENRNNTGHNPTVICLPYVTENRNSDGTYKPDGSANDTATAGESTAEDINAYVYVDTDRAPAMGLQIAQQYGKNNGHLRVIPVYQRVKTPDFPHLVSGAAYAAAHRIACDGSLEDDGKPNGIQTSQSNRVMPHVSRVDPEISWRAINNHDTDSAALEAANVLCFIQRDGAHYMWGGQTRTAAPTNVLKNIPFNRVVDEWERRTLLASIHLIDGGLVGAFVADIVELAQGIFEHMAGEDLLVDGRAWDPGPTVNTPENLANGKLTISATIDGIPILRELVYRVTPRLGVAI